MDIFFRCPECGQRMAVEKTDGEMTINCPRCHQTSTLSNPVGARPHLPVGTAPPVAGATPTPIPDGDLVPINLPEKLDPTTLLICPECHAVKKKTFAWHWFGKAKHSPPHPVFCHKCKCQMLPADSPCGQALLMQLLRD